MTVIRGLRISLRALQITAALLLAYMLVLTVAEIGPWLEMRLLFEPNRPGWVTPSLFMIALGNLLLWPLWCHLANRTLQPLAHPPLKNPPLMASAWFVVPGAFLLMPWLVVREIYLASQDPLNWEDGKAPVVGWWWCLRLVSYFGVWPTMLLDPSGATRGQLILQLIIIVEMGLQIMLVSQMTRLLVQPLDVEAAEAF